MLKREIEIDGKLVPFRSSATIPRLYRVKFKRDIFKDLAKLEQAYTRSQPDKQLFADDEVVSDGSFEIDDLEIFENVAYIMAYHADNAIPQNINDWLDQFDMFSIYEVLPQILELWGENIMTEVRAKKELAGVNGR
ncbi:MAG: hypothetical protein LUE11_05415 [Clostridia bacterium]|nr:hypothetical protein [Clostridia bacterium]